jgi:large subunit ribosomal protein L1
MKHGKKYRESLKKYDPAIHYDLIPAVQKVKELAFAKFDETVDISIKLNLKKSQTVRDTRSSSSFAGEKRLLYSLREKKKSLDAGAALSVSVDLIVKVKGGWLVFM